MTIPADPYRQLGLPRDATAEEIKHAYRRLAKQYHPDSAGPAATARFIAIQRAYESLVPGGRDLGAAELRGRPAPTARGHPGATQGSAGAPRGPSPGNAGSAGPSRPTHEDSGRRRARATARPGSTSYDGALPFEPEWQGATWYGPSSGTYWTVNPREYADPRKHGPGYLARGRTASPFPGTSRRPAGGTAAGDAAAHGAAAAHGTAGTAGMATAGSHAGTRDGASAGEPGDGAGAPNPAADGGRVDRGARPDSRGLLERLTARLGLPVRRARR